MIEVRRNNQQPRARLAHDELAHATVGRRIEPAIENGELDQTADNKQAVGTPLMQTPRPMPTGQRRRQMNLNDRTAEDIPTGASYFADIPIFMGNRTRRTKYDIVDRSSPEPALRIDGGLLCHKFRSTEDIG